MRPFLKAVAAVGFFTELVATSNCPYLGHAACSSPAQRHFLVLWQQRIRCWLCNNITADLAAEGVKLLKELVSLDLDVTADGRITRPWLGACIPPYLLAMLATTRAVRLQPWKVYRFGLQLLQRCSYDSSTFFSRFGVTPEQLAYVFGLIGQRYGSDADMPKVQGLEHLAVSTALAEGLSGRVWDAPLVIDVGMGLGADARYYMQQGFRVVAVEANPRAVDAVLSDPATSPFLTKGQINVLHAAIVGPNNTEANIPFFVLPQRPEQSKSLSWVALDGGKEISVRTVRCADVLRVHGQPVYMKVDVEFNTLDCLASLHAEATQQRAANRVWKPPRLLSLEVEAAELVETMHKQLVELGYAHYKVCRQFLYSPGPCEQSTYDPEIPGCGSGPFGEAAVDYRHGIHWRSLRELPIDVDFLREFDGGLDWFDLHVKLPD